MRSKFINAYKLLIFHVKRLKREIFADKMLSDSSIANEYIDSVIEILKSDESFDDFRRNQKYKSILEHVDENLALKYFNNIKKSISEQEILNYCKAINNSGNPLLIEINNKLYSPTSLRYLNVAIDINSKFPNVSLKNVVEIGPGYGGQSLILQKFFKIENYHYVDLPDVNKLIEKFLDKNSIDFKPHFHTLDTIDTDIDFDLVISNYAFSELPKSIQVDSINKIINNSKNGYFILNNFYKYSLRYLTQKNYKTLIKNLEIHEEVPSSYVFNKLAVFKDTKYKA